MRLIIKESQVRNLIDKIITEQEQAPTVQSKEFVLPNNTFASGQYENFNTQAVDGVIAQLNEYLKKYPTNQKIKVEIESSESKVPNRIMKKGKLERVDAGVISKLRAEKMMDYLKGRLPNNVEVTIKDLGAQGTEWDDSKKEGETDTQYANRMRALARDPEYTKYQYVKFKIVGSGENDEQKCKLGFQIIVEYKEEWCKPGVDESLCHKCDNAEFYMWANGIPLTNSKGIRVIDLNNNIGSKPSGPSRRAVLVVSSQQKEQILKVNPNEISITYGCALASCHSDPAYISIIDFNGTTLLPGTFVTKKGNKLSSANKPIEILKLDACSKVISMPSLNQTSQTTPQPPQQKTQYYNLVQDPSKPNDYTVESLYQMYKNVQNGIINLPKDSNGRIDRTYAKYLQYDGVKWDDFVKTFKINNNNLQALYNYVKTQK